MGVSHSDFLSTMSMSWNNASQWYHYSTEVLYQFSTITLPLECFFKKNPTRKIALRAEKGRGSSISGNATVGILHRTP